MARKLPWERRGPQSRQPAAASRSSSSPGSSTRRQDFGNARARERKGPTSRSSEPEAVVRRDRSPSTSPPPAPPSESFMIDGMENDDQYRMVEDELLDVARTFTAHLHAAEYQRLKGLAKSQNADALRSISRPVTSAPTDRVRKKLELTKRVAKQQRGLRRAFAGGGGEDEDTEVHEDSPWAGTSLQNLMEGSPTKLNTLRPLMPLKPIARTSGSAFLVRPSFAHPPTPTAVSDTDEDEDDEDDLDGPSTYRNERRAVAESVSASHVEQSPLCGVAHKTSATVAPLSGKKTVSFEPEPKRREILASSDNDVGEDVDLSDELDSGNLLVKLRRRRKREKAQWLKMREQEQWRARQQRQQGRNENAPTTTEEQAAPQPRSLDVIPSFL